MNEEVADFHERALQLWLAQNFDVEDGEPSARSGYGTSYKTFINGVIKKDGLTAPNTDRPIEVQADHWKRELIEWSNDVGSKRICLRVPPQVKMDSCPECGDVTTRIRARLHFVVDGMIPHVQRPAAD